MEDDPLVKKFGNHCTDNKPKAQKQTQRPAPGAEAKALRLFPLLAEGISIGSPVSPLRCLAQTLESDVVRVLAAAFTVLRTWRLGRESTSLCVLVCGVGPRGRCTPAVSRGSLSSPRRSALSRCERWKEPYTSNQKPPAKSSFDLTTQSLETPT